MEGYDLEIDIGLIPETVQGCDLEILYRDRLKDICSLDLQVIPKTFQVASFVVPTCMRDLSPSSFHPRLVSIGPMHREDKIVQASEGLKTSYLINFLKRMSSPQEEILKSCVRKVRASLEQIKACYASTKSIHVPTFVEMVVVDACFILEFLLKNWESYRKPYSGRSLLVQTVLHDLMLLENQLPFFILNELFQCTILAINPKASLVDLVLPILSCNNLFTPDVIIDNVSINNAPHMLGLLHHCYRPRVNKATSYSRITTLLSTVHLQKACVTFKPHKDSTSHLSAHYSRFFNKLTFTMPVLRVDDYTETLLWNFLAYEQSYADQPHASHKHITSYVYAICMLANTEEDVAKLADSGVIVNYLGSNGAVVSIFNTILKHKKNCKTSDTYFNGYEITARTTSFKIPWNMIALLVITGFVLAVAQTIITIKYGGRNK